MDSTRDRWIAAHAARQHGVFTLEQADEAGFKPDQREVRLRSGRWELVHPGVYRIAGSPRTWKAMLLADCLGAHDLAVASHRSAAELWGLPGGRADVVEITCRRWQRSFGAGLIVHETKSLRPDDIVCIDSIPVTTVEQTLLGLAAVVSVAVVDMAFDRALRLQLTDAARVEAFLRVKGGRGRNGVGVLRELLRQHDPLAGIPESAMETKLKRLLRRHGFPTPVFQYVIRHQGRFVARVDAAYPELRIAIEFDSYEHHMGKLAIVRDNDRRNQLKRIHWEPITFTSADLSRDGGRAIEALHVARRTASSVSA